MIWEILSSPRVVLFLIGWTVFAAIFGLFLARIIHRTGDEPEVDEADIGTPEGWSYFDPDQDRGDRK